MKTVPKPRIARHAISPVCYQVWFAVESIHGTSLEFVLDDADARAHRPTRIELQRQGRTFTSYSQALHDMLVAEFSKNAFIRIRESQEYGTLSFLVEADSPKALQRAYGRCEKVTQRWLNKYRVNSMKRNTK
jgi:hypothetical protein